MIDDLRAKALHLREQLVAHAERHIEGEDEAVKLVGLADELVSLTNKLAAIIAPSIGEPVTPAADAALRKANEIAVIIGQYPRMFGAEEYHARLAEQGRRLRALLNEAGYPAPGSVPEG